MRVLMRPALRAAAVVAVRPEVEEVLPAHRAAVEEAEVPAAVDKISTNIK